MLKGIQPMPLESVAITITQRHSANIDNRTAVQPVEDELKMMLDAGYAKGRLSIKQPSFAFKDHDGGGDSGIVR